METNKILHGNCIDRLQEIDANNIDLVYFDPPFFTQKKHSLTNRENTKTYEFDDKYESLEEYLCLIEKTLIQSKRVLIQEVFSYIATRPLHTISELF
jgi:site-specific DNA-methyltransferase (adenine-specific)